MYARIPLLLLLASSALGASFNKAPRHWHRYHYKADDCDENNNGTVPNNNPGIPGYSSGSSSSSSSTTSSSTTTQISVANAGAGGNKAMVTPPPMPGPNQGSTTSSSTDTATSTSSSAASGSSGGTFTLNTYYGGPDMPFTLSQDQAPMMNGTDYVDLHNQYRALHGVPPVTGNDTMQQVVNAFAADMGPQGACKQGDDMVFPGGSNWLHGTMDPAKDLHMWYNERANFSAMSGDYTLPMHDDSYCAPYGNAGQCAQSPMFEHFTAMVWKSATSVACAVTPQCGDPGWPEATGTVCLYWPGGNVIDSNAMLLYEGEVFKPSS